MCKKPASNDQAGYIYILDIEGKLYVVAHRFTYLFLLDTNDQDLIHFKVSCTNAMNHHLVEHNH